jgi:peptidoglycan hydrolase CwlO-like protein
MLATLATGSFAAIGTQLHSAKARLVALAGQIKTEEARVVTLQDRLAAVDRHIAAATVKANLIHGELTRTQRLIVTARDRAAALQTRLNAMARSAFISAPGGPSAGFLEVILGAGSPQDLMDRVAYISSVTQGQVDIANQVAQAKARFTNTATDLGKLSAQQTALLAQLASDRRTQASAVSEQRAALTSLDQLRTKIEDLVVRLKKELKAEQLAAIAASFQGNNNAPYGQWAGLFMTTMHLPSCHSNMVAMVAWQLSEFTQAAWNPLATTEPMPGSSTFNYAGVQNFGSIDQGLQATQLTLENGLTTHGYGAIVSSLLNCADAMTTADAINASDWCGGCAGGAYVTDNIARVEANYPLYAAL